MTLLPGAECSQLLSLEKVTWLWIPLPTPHPPCASSPRGPIPPPSPPPTDTHTHITTTHFLSPASLVHSSPLRGHFLHNHVAPPRPLFSSAPIRLAQQGAVNSPRSANFHTFFRLGMPASLQRLVLAPPPRSPTDTTLTHTRHTILHAGSASHSPGFSEAGEPGWHM